MVSHRNKIKRTKGQRLCIKPQTTPIRQDRHCRRGNVFEPRVGVVSCVDFGEGAERSSRTTTRHHM